MNHKIIQYLSNSEVDARQQLTDLLLRDCPIPEKELLHQLPLFLRRQQVTSILFLQHLYEQILGVHGIIMEFGTRWGRQLAIWQALRGIYEPYNYTRQIIAFDTFAGFVDVAPQDGRSENVTAGAYGVSKGYEDYLAKILAAHEQESPIPHIHKWQLVCGDVRKTLSGYLTEHPETIIAFAYLDLDLYEPTKLVLEQITPFLTKGSIIVFDELVHPDFPGETVALRETFGLDRFELKRWPHHSRPAYCVVR